MGRRDSEIQQPVPAVIGVLLISAAIVATVWLVRDFGPRSFPDDHGLTPASPEWVRCAAETIERHPTPFTTGDFLLTQKDRRSGVVDGTFRTIEVTLVEGGLVYWWGRGSRTLWLDCPEVGLVSAEQRREELEAAAAARSCSERYGVRVLAEGDSVRLGLSAETTTIQQCGHRGEMTVRIRDADGNDVSVWSVSESLEGLATDWIVSNWCEAEPAWVHVEWEGGSVSEPFGPAPACVDVDAPFAVTAAP